MVLGNDTLIKESKKNIERNTFTFHKKEKKQTFKQNIYV